MLYFTISQHTELLLKGPHSLQIRCSFAKTFISKNISAKIFFFIMDSQIILVDSRAKVLCRGLLSSEGKINYIFIILYFYTSII